MTGCWVEMHEFEVPQLVLDELLDSVVWRWMALYGLKWMTGRGFYGMRRSIGPTVERQARWFLLRDILLEKYGRDVSTIDVQRDLTDLAREIVINSMYTNTKPESYLEREYSDSISVQYRVMTGKLFERLADSFQIQYEEPATFLEGTGPKLPEE